MRCPALRALLRALLRCWLGRAPPLPRARPSLRGRTAIVTGGSGGIGEATALELARCGARVVLATRSKQRGEAAAHRIRTETGNPDVRFMHLDLASLRSVRAFASAFLREEPHLHLLINNAGVSAGGTTEDGFSLTFQVNHLGHFLLTELLLARLQSCSPSRVVIVASSAHRAARLRLHALGSPSPGPLGPFQDYCDSKLANVLHARELAARLRGTGVTCYAAHPGFVATGLFRHAPLWLKPLLVPLAWLWFRSAAEGAQTPLHCALHRGLEPLSGCYFSDCAPQEPCPPGADERLARALREGSRRLLGLCGDGDHDRHSHGTATAQH
ncbi:dehydrogenase/reductase SDR family member 13 [Melopsittacus undulatus]|uniref:dehydrogenase/reductase SDR family member 13 n=1 Tax=Melopsittacus undulatus TaxID=13146 RepID=UPI00146F57BB|nr:dehydrogenase/reductase SDR family member 13 [Melopsittacus undulatus]